jgi:NTE family protein
MQNFTVRDIGRAIDRLYSSLYFEKVGYTLEKTENGTRLVIRVKENADGSLRFGLHYDSNYKSAILLNTTFRNLLFNGSKFSINSGLGENPFFKTEIFKNNGWKPGFGLAFQSSRSEAFFYHNSRKISSLNFFETKFQLYSMGIFRNSHAMGVGIEYENSLIRPIIDPGESITESRYRLINYYAFLQMDSYDNVFYPSRGIKLHSGLKLITSKEILPVAFVHIRLSKAEKITDRLTLIGHVYGGSVEGDSIPSQYLFFSGGIIESYRNGLMPFAGLDYMEIASKNILSLKMDFQVNIYRDIFIVGIINAGNFKNSFNDLFSVNNILSGYGVSLGYNSLIGPLEIGLSRSANHTGIQGDLRIGYWF